MYPNRNEPPRADRSLRKGAGNSSRRRFLRRAAYGALILFGGGTTWSVATERNRLKVYRVTAQLPTLPMAMEGFTICQLSDIHCGPLVSEEQVRRGVDLAMSLGAELIVLTGDFVWRGAKHAEAAGRALSSLRAPQGVYGILGNHDYWSGDVSRVTKALSEAGVQMLINRSVPLRTKGETWWLCGLDDVWSGSPDLGGTLAEVPPGSFKILLCHEPDFADKAIAMKIPLQLSGHSHGGQIRLPFVAAPMLPYLGNNYPIGLQQVKNSRCWVYTNVGLGVVAPPIRVNCPPEVTHMTLRRG